MRLFQNSNRSMPTTKIYFEHRVESSNHVYRSEDTWPAAETLQNTKYLGVCWDNHHQHSQLRRALIERR